MQANYHGNWSALFCTGDLQPQPPIAIEERTYRFANSTGYDGQFYHYIAHDPFLRSDLPRYVDDSRLRYRRILVPLAAYVLSLGRSDLIDTSYAVVCLLGLGLGVYWSCRVAQDAGMAPAWGLLFLATPAVLVTIDRNVIDGSLAALTAGFVCYSGRSRPKLFLVLACAVLARETGLFLAMATCLFFAARKDWRASGISLLSAVPAAAWYLYVQTRTAGMPTGISFVPLSSILLALTHPWPYPPGTPLIGAIHIADGLALSGGLLAIAFGFLWFIRKPADPPRIAALLFALMGVFIQRPEHWENVYHFGRIYSPLLLCLAANAAQFRFPWLLLPAACMLPRLAIQVAPQAIGIAHWVAKFSFT